MIKIKLGEAPPSSVMSLANGRRCIIREDGIYGLMSASGVIIQPERSETLERAWARWWAHSLGSGDLFWLSQVAPSGTWQVGTPQVANPAWNCVMPVCEKRYSALSLPSPIAKAWDAVSVHEGTVILPVKRAGKFHVERLIYKDQIPETIEDLSQLYRA